MPSEEADVQKEREMKDEFMARHPESPFIVGEASGFRGLRYFPIDPAFRVSATLERLAAPLEAFLRTNRDGQLTCRYLGDLRFELGGQDLRLRVYHAGEQVGPSVFVPFRDATCGTESYAPGRYLTLQLTEDDRYLLDFNLAFNPYCAYTDRFECGFPPAENDLPIPIRAGEMVWTEGETPAMAAPRRRTATKGRTGPASKPRMSPPARRAVPPRSQKTRKAPARKPRTGRRTRRS